MNDQTGSGDAKPSQRNEAVPPDLYAARVTGSRETLAKLMQTFELDVGCRHPHVEPNPDRTATLIVYVTDDRIREIQAAGYKVERGENVSALGRERQKEVGEGDRFEGGRVAPRGLGEKPGRDRKGGSAS
jgi:hypothetical protein